MSDPRGEGARLLARFRTLCEALGVARANGVPLAAPAQEELRRLETRLVALLEVGIPAPRSKPSAGLEADSRPGSGGGERHPHPNSLPEGEGIRESLAKGEGISVSHPLGEGDRSTGADHVIEGSVAGSSTATAFTDGSAEGNPGPGGYCAIVRVPGRPDRELSGGTNYTTNNQMELTAAITGLTEALASGATNVTVVTDSEYVVKGTTQWLKGWERNGWKTASGQPVKNRELWEKIAELTRGRGVHWQWVKGHAGHPENERADLIATTRAREAATTRRG